MGRRCVELGATLATKWRNPFELMQLDKVGCFQQALHGNVKPGQSGGRTVHETFPTFHSPN